MDGKRGFFVNDMKTRRCLRDKYGHSTYSLEAYNFGNLQLGKSIFLETSESFTESLLMYSVTVESRFSATHQLRLACGDLEPMHGHDWLVRAKVRALDLCDLGMVVDFHRLESLLNDVVGVLHHKHLNSVEVLHGKNPTAEVLARHVFDAVRAKGLEGLTRVEVTEAPGCIAAYEPL